MIKKYKNLIHLIANLISLESIILILYMFDNDIVFKMIKYDFISSYFYDFIYLFLRIIITEEMIFREGVLNFLKKRTKYYNLIQAILFSIFHLNFGKIYFIKNTGLNLLFSFVIGTIYGNIRNKVKNIELCIVLRAISFFSSVYFEIFILKYFLSLKNVSVIKNNELISLFIIFISIYILSLKKFIIIMRTEKKNE